MLPIISSGVWTGYSQLNDKSQRERAKRKACRCRLHYTNLLPFRQQALFDVQMIEEMNVWSGGLLNLSRTLAELGLAASPKF